MKPEYYKGAEARKSFETAMSKLFRAPKKEVSKPKLKPSHPPKGENDK